MPELTAERLRSLLHYDPATGDFTWTRPTKGKVKNGGPAGYFRRDRYRIIVVDGVKYYAHRLAWLYVHGVWPSSVIDHINGDPSDNRICNLRDVSQQVNCFNREAAGYRHHKHLGRNKPYEALIVVDGKQRSLGYFHSKAEAHRAYLKAKEAVVEAVL